MNLTIKDLPESLHSKLKAKAEETGRSLNKLVIYTLEQNFASQKIDEKQWLERVRNRRKKMNFSVDEESLNEAKRSGRA